MVVTSYEDGLAGSAPSRAQGGRRAAVRRIGVLFGVAATVALALLAGGFILFIARLERFPAVPLRHADGVVVLTGGQDRVTVALTLLARGVADRLLISGVNPTTSEAEIARLVPEARPFFDCCVELGYAAENTTGNAAETGRWARQHAIRSLIVVTSNYHMPRALAEIAHAAPGVALTPYPVVPERAREAVWLMGGQRFRMMLAEYLKYLAVQARLCVLTGKAPPT